MKRLARKEHKKLKIHINLGMAIITYQSVLENFDRINQYFPNNTRYFKVVMVSSRVVKKVLFLSAFWLKYPLHLKKNYSDGVLLTTTKINSEQFVKSHLKQSLGGF